MFNWIASGLVGAGGGAWAVGRMLAPRERAGASDAIAVTPVSFETQEVARWLGYEEQRRQAVSKLSQEGTLSRAGAQVAVDALITDRSLPTSYSQAAATLKAQWPELAERVLTLSRENRRAEAVRAVREETGVGLVVAARLVETLTS